MLHWSSHFKKQFKLPHKTQERIFDRLNLLIDDEFNQVLRNHKLHGIYSEYRSINITGDIRLLYKKVDNHIYLALIGSHSELYE